MLDNNHLVILTIIICFFTLCAIVLYLLVQTPELRRLIKNLFVKKYNEVIPDPTWKESSVIEFLGPIYIQLKRTYHFIELEEKGNHPRTFSLVLQGQEAIRSVILTKTHLIPPHLMQDAHMLLHYCDLSLAHTHPKDSPLADNKTQDQYLMETSASFPHLSSERFKRCFMDYWTELYSLGSL